MNFHEIKVGDYLMAEYEGTARRGVVTNLNGDEKQVCVDDGVQEFWYELPHLRHLDVSEGELFNLKFQKHVNDDGTVKFSKGAFRMLIPKEHDFSRMEIWYKDEARHIERPLHLNELQNHFLEMTKVHLDDQEFD